MRTIGFLSVLAATASVVLSSACSTAPSLAVDGGGAARDRADAGIVGQDGSSQRDFGCEAGPGVAYVVCPPTPPAFGTACPALGEDCEYGSSWWLGCNLVVRCTASGWAQAPAELQQGCHLRDAGGSCPATWVEASAIDASLATCPAAECQYPEGYCVCMFLCGSVGQWRPEIRGSWYCAPATSECPSPRPDLGTGCTKTAACTYGEQCGCGEDLQCVGDVWQGGATSACP